MSYAFLKLVEVVEYNLIVLAVKYT